MFYYTKESYLRKMNSDISITYIYKVLSLVSMISLPLLYKMCYILIQHASITKNIH